MATAALTPNAFRRLGKPKGATYWLIRHALSYSVDEMDNRCPHIFDSPNCPLFSRLSLSHRLALLADLAQGLLCPDTPLPPDTLEHHAAFLYLFSFAFENIEGSELEMLAEDESDEEEEEGLEAAEAYDEGDLGELSEDDSAEVAQQLRSALELAAPVMAAAAPAKEEQRRSMKTRRNEEMHRKSVRHLMVSRKDDLEDKKLVARVAEGLRGQSDEQLVCVMMSGHQRCGRTYQDAILMAQTFISLAPNRAAAEAATCDWGRPHITRERLREARACAGPQLRAIAAQPLPCYGYCHGVYLLLLGCKTPQSPLSGNAPLKQQAWLCLPPHPAADTPPPVGRTSFAALLAAHVRQRFPQLTRLDQYCESHTTWQMLSSLKFGIGPCLELSEEEMELQYGEYHDACYYRREDVARSLLVERHVQRATEAFQQRWQPEMDILHWRLIEASCPPYGWYSAPLLKPNGYAIALQRVETARQDRSRYIQLLHGAVEDPALLEQAETLEHRLYYIEAERLSWMADWHKVVRRLGGYGSMAARLQAVRLVHPRHPTAAMVSGRPRWLGSETPQEQVAEMWREEWNMECDYSL
ncbi:hypothetical protein ABPG75_011289 [Micractinium tetrahymenae]